MQIRRTTLLRMTGDKTAQKAVSLLLMLKSRLGRTSSVKKASPNKIAGIAGCHPTTIKRYLPVWVEMGLVEWQGKGRDVLVVKKLHSKNKKKNVCIEKLDYRTFKDLLHTMRALLFLVLQSHKAFIKRLIRVANNPKRGEDFKRARRLSESYAIRENGELKYKEHGLSFRTIGQRLGYCTKTAQKIVKTAINRHWCEKTRNYERQLMPNVCGMYVEGYTFTTRNYGYRVHANTYELSPYWYGILLDGKK